MIQISQSSKFPGLPPVSSPSPPESSPAPSPSAPPIVPGSITAQALHRLWRGDAFVHVPDELLGVEDALEVMVAAHLLLGIHGSPLTFIEAQMGYGPNIYRSAIRRDAKRIGLAIYCPQADPSVFLQRTKGVLQDCHITTKFVRDGKFAEHWNANGHRTSASVQVMQLGGDPHPILYAGPAVCRDIPLYVSLGGQPLPGGPTLP